MVIKIEFDDGLAKRLKNRAGGEKFPPAVKVRERGFFLVLEDGREFKIPISFMRISEIKPLEELLNEIGIMA